MSSIVFGAAAALIIGVAAFIAAGALWRLRREPVPGGLGAMLARHGLDWGRLAAVGSIGEVSAALDRCAACRGREGCESFCANAAFLERMKAAAQR